MRKPLAGVLAALVVASAFPAGAWSQLAAPRAAGAAARVPVVPAAPVSLHAPLSAPSFALGAPGLTPPNLLSPSPAARPSANTQTPAVVLSHPAAAATQAAALPAASLRVVAAAEVPALIAASRPANDDAPALPSTEALDVPRRSGLRTRFAELRAAFDLRRREDLAVTDAAPSRSLRAPLAAPNEAEEQPAPAVPAPRPAKSGLLGFGTALTFFLGALAVEQLGNETQAAAMPTLIAKVFGDVTVSADLGIWSALSDFAGSLLAPFVIKRLGLKAAYLWTAGARLASGAAIAGFLAVGHMTVPALMAATVLGGFFWGMNYTVEKAIPAVLLEQDRGALERFKAARQSVIEVVATVIPVATGATVAAFGFLPALIAFPLAAGASMLIVALTLRIPAKAEVLMRRSLAAPGTGVKGFWRSLTRGARVVLRTPRLRTAFWGYSLFFVTTPLLYWLVAPAYGLFIAGPGMEDDAAFVQGVMTGLFSLGGLLASVFMMREHKRLGRLGEAERKTALSRSLVRWSWLGTFSLAALGAMALPIPAWGGLTFAALALLPFGVAQVVAKLKVESYFQSQAPPDAIDDATAFMEGASMLVQMAVLWAAKLAFTSFTGLGPFIALALAMVPFAAAAAWMTRRLAKHQESG